jgi:hydrogenase maturation factor HypF (carbamoyltransferase family)
MTDAVDPRSSNAQDLAPCPRCGGELTEPISGDVHCYRECTGCGTRFELDDPELMKAPT